MARPIKTGMDYFPHDCDAANDEKIEAMRAFYGNDGYAFYFILLERIYRAAKAELNVSNPALKAALIKKIGIDNKRFEDMFQTALQLGLFDKEAYKENIITSNGAKKRYEEVAKLRERWRKKKVPVEKKDDSKDNGGVFPQENVGDNAGENEGKGTQNKTKQNKTKKSIYISCQHLTMTEAEYKKLINKYGKQAVAEKLEYAENYKNLKNYVSLYLTLNNWLKKDIENTKDDISDIKR